MYRARCFTAGLLFDLGQVLGALGRYADRLAFAALPARRSPSLGESSNAEIDGAIHR
jgi:hypothetical protein